MKHIIAATLIALAYGGAAFAEEKDHDHDHDHDKIVAGPTGGRVLTIVEPHAEFFVNKEKKVEIRFVDDDLKVVAPGEQSVSVIMGDRTKPTKLTFTKDGDKLVSDKAVPEGNDHPTVVSIKEKKGAKSKVAKFNLNLNDCPECKNKEYACECEHDHDHEGAEEKK
ncbi:MAG: hypothetical protein R3F11_11955 [Verrucomicrobiales bacterium]